MLEGPPWYQGDHMVFVQNGVPAVAITSEQAMQYLATITHSVRDRPELVDSAKLVHIALALQDLLLNLEHGLAPVHAPRVS
jgi:aminopeptidase YwaD